MYIGLDVKYPFCLSDFNETLICWIYFLKKTQMSSFMKIHAAGSELFHADGRTDMTKLRVAFRNGSNAPEIVFVQVSKHLKDRQHYCRQYSR